MKPLCSPQHGFSLLEVLVGLGAAGALFAVLVSFFHDFGRSSTRQNAAAEAQQTARAGLDFLARELRLAGLDPLLRSGAGIEDISTSGNRVRFTADICDRPIGSTCSEPAADGNVDGAGERITYLYDAAAGELRRMLYEGTPSQSWVVLVSGVVANPGGDKLFTFLDASGNEIVDNAQRAAIRTVAVTLSVREPAGQSGSVTRTYAARVRLRNIGL